MKPRRSARVDLRYLLRQFHELPRAAQNSLLKDLYQSSAGTKVMIANRLVGEADFSELILQMERETTGKVYRRGMPGTPNGRVVASVIATAKKARAPYSVMMQLEQLAYRGFIEFLEKFGGGPDSFLELGPKHLGAYLDLVKDNLEPAEQKTIFYEMRDYLRRKDNMITDFIDEVFEEKTGVHVR